MKVADFLLERLRSWGVTDVFGCPGDGINGLIAAFGRAEDDPRFRRTPAPDRTARRWAGPRRS